MASALQETRQIIAAQVSWTLEEINTQMALLGADATQMDITSVMKKAMQTAFQSVPEAEQKKLYHAFSLKVHPDKLATSDEPFALLLRNKALTQIPQQALQDVYEHPALEKTSNLQTKAEDYARKNIDRPLTFVEKAALWVVKRCSPLFTKLDESSQPWKGLSYFLVISSGIVLGVAWIVGVPLWVSRKIEKIGVNVVTEGGYQRNMDAFATDEKVLQVIKNKLKTMGVDIAEEQDAEILPIYLRLLRANTEQKKKIFNEKKVLDDLHNEVKESMGEFRALAMMARAFGEAITKPLPGGLFGNSRSLIMRAIQVLTALPSIALSAGLTILSTAATGVVLVLGAALATVLIAVVALTSLPLYLMDALFYLARGGRPAPPKHAMNGVEQPVPGVPGATFKTWTFYGAASKEERRKARDEVHSVFSQFGLNSHPEARRSEPRATSNPTVSTHSIFSRPEDRTQPALIAETAHVTLC